MKSIPITGVSLLAGSLASMARAGNSLKDVSAVLQTTRVPSHRYSLSPAERGCLPQAQNGSSGLLFLETFDYERKQQCSDK